MTYLASSPSGAEAAARALRPGALLFLLLLPAAACGDRAESRPATDPGRRRADRVEPVQVVVAELASAARSVSATGTVEPLRSVAVVSQLSGPLEAVAVEEGDRVGAGAVLARIDVPEIRAQLASAEAALDAARKTADRSTQLFREGIITAMENERDQTALAAAVAARDQLRTRLGYAVVRAPVSGVILERRVQGGDLASPQMRLFTIGEISTLVVRVPVSELDVVSLRPSSAVEVSLDAFPGRAFTGEIRRIFPAADSVTRLVPVEVALAGAATREARPGFLARVTFRLAPRTGVLMVPGNAVLENPRGAVVYIVKDGRASLRAVERGTTYEGRVEIRNGLVPGDSVVVAGNTMLRDGAAVRVVEPARPGVVPRDSSGTTVGAR